MPLGTFHFFFELTLSFTLALTLSLRVFFFGLCRSLQGLALLSEIVSSARKLYRNVIPQTFLTQWKIIELNFHLSAKNRLVQTRHRFNYTAARSHNLNYNWNCFRDQLLLDFILLFSFSVGGGGAYRSSNHFPIQIKLAIKEIHNCFLISTLFSNDSLHFSLLVCVENGFFFAFGL